MPIEAKGFNEILKLHTHNHKYLIETIHIIIEEQYIIVRKLINLPVQ